jgi:hypothetical protein
MNKTVNNYDAWADQYENNTNPTRDLDKVVTQKSLSNLNFSNVLELGCGSGKTLTVSSLKQINWLDHTRPFIEIKLASVSSANNLNPQATRS